jgi:hypothetical protein
MRIITIGDKKVRDYLTAKDECVIEGRKLSAKIEIIDLKLEKNKDKQRKYTAECTPKTLIAEGNVLSRRIEKDLTHLEEIQREVHKLKVQNIPEAVGTEYEDLKKQKEDLEIERNKAAIKTQKLKDRLVPIVKRHIRPQLGEFEDMETVELNGDVIEVKVFDHVEDFKTKFAEKKAA